MSVYNAQFYRLDLRLLDDRAFVELMKSPEFAVYLQLVRYVWRSRQPHPIERVNRLRSEGLLVAAVEREVIATKVGVQPSYVSRLVKDLEAQGLLRRIRTGRQSVFVLGEWEDRSFNGDGSYIVEIFFLQQRFGADGRPQIRTGEASGESDEVDSPSISDVDSKSDRPREVDSRSTSEVSGSGHRGSEVDSPSTSEMDSESTSEVRFRARPSELTAEVDSPSTSEMDSESTSIINRKEREIDIHHLSLSSGSGERARSEIAQVLRRYGRQSPGGGTESRWLELCGGSERLVLECLHRLGRQGHLEDKPDQYIVATLERAGRQAGRQSVRREEGDGDDGVYVVR